MAWRPDVALGEMDGAERAGAKPAHIDFDTLSTPILVAPIPTDAP
jgi:hypothetical protein